MLQRLIAALLGLLGIAAAALGIASATAWRADDPLVATATAETSTLVTEPGVLEVAGDPVTVTVRAEGSPVVLAVGRDTDVSGWIGADPHELVTGLADWHDLALSTGTTEPTASATAESTAEATDEPSAEPSPSASEAAEDSASTAADPTGSDMWITEVSGDGSATLEWTAPDSGRWSLLAVSLGETTPTLELSWPQEVTTPWLWPGVAVGVLLIAIAAIMAIRMRRAASGADWHDVNTGMIAVVTPTTGATDPSGGTSTATAGLPTVTGTVPLIDPTTGQPMTRRQIREAEAAAAASRRGRRGATGAIPVVTGATPAVTGPVPTPADVAPDSSDTAAGRSDADAPTIRAAGTAAIPTASDSAAAAPGRSGEGPTGAASAATASGTAPTDAPKPDGPTTPEPPQEQTGGRRSLLGRFRRAKDIPTPAPTPENTESTTPTASRTPTGPTSEAAPERPAGPTWSAVPPVAPSAGPESAPSAGPAPAPATGPAQSARPTPVAGPTPATAPAPADTSDAAAVEESEAAPRKGRGSRLPWRKPREESAPVDPAPAGAPTSATPSVDDDAAPAVPGVDEEDDSLTTTQRADSWRRMWGFPSDAESGSTPPSGLDDKEEDR